MFFDLGWLKMNILRFRRGFKHWECTYTVEIDFEYTADLEKKITEIIFYQPQNNLRVRVLWDVLRKYLEGSVSRPYVNESGLKLEMVKNDLHISNSRFFHIKVHEDQRRAICVAARNVKENISSSVDRILRESVSVPSPSRR